MSYPTMDQVNGATHLEIARWSRFLPSPGQDSINAGRAQFDRATEVEGPVMDRIVERLRGFGGMTPAISKEIGL